MGHVAKSSVLHYMGSFSATIFGFIYWVIVSFFVSPAVVGDVSAVIALQNLINATMSLGLSVGLRRFIGISLKDERKTLSTYFFSALIFTLIINVPIAFILMIPIFLGIGVFNLAAFELFFVLILFILSFWTPLLTSLFNSILRTNVTATAHIISSLSKILIGVTLVYLGLDFLGVIIGFLAGSIMTDAVLVHYFLKLVKEFNFTFSVDMAHLKDLLRAGLPSWGPYILTIAAQSAGILSIYGFIGEADTGLYYIAYAIASAVYSISLSIQLLMMPVLSGMSDGRKRSASKSITLAMIISAPAAIALAIYPWVPFLFLGPSYSDASTLLRILVLGAVLMPLIDGYYSYAYAVGKYSHVVSMAIALDTTRLILYVPLIILFGAEGIAASFIIGTVVAFLVVLALSRKSEFKYQWKQMSLIVIIPLGLGCALIAFNVIWWIGILSILLLSFLFYTRLGVLPKEDIHEIIDSFISNDTKKRFQRFGSLIMKILYAS